MKFLFIHNNYPAQFLHIAAVLSHNPENEVVFLAQHNRRPELQLPKVNYVQVGATEQNEIKNEAEKVTINHLKTGEHFANAMLDLAKTGFYPDVVYDHPGWGGSLFIPDIFPKAARVCFFEWFYTKYADYAFKARGKTRPAAHFAANRMRNLCQLDALRECDFGIVPTMWQLAQYPVEFSSKLHVIHDGVDTDFFAPLEKSSRVLDGVDLSGVSEVVTYATRGLEPYRGFPQFYRGIPAILENRPQCHVVIMADDDVFYSSPRSDGKTWGQAMREEIPVDTSRVHFINFSSYETYRTLLHLSSVHVYMTMPFVLSWSLLEAMSCQCLVVGSDTDPVREVIRHNENGILTPFWNHEVLANTVIDALNNREKYHDLCISARQTITDRYELRKTLPQQIRILEMAALHKGRIIEKHNMRDS